MASKFFSWSKGDSRQYSEYRVGGLLPIEASDSDTAKETYLGGLAQNAPQNAPRLQGRPKPPNLTIIPAYNGHVNCLVPTSGLHYAAVSSASNLLAVVNDMLRSPALSAGIFPRSDVHKPLPSRPRSISLPSTPQLAELPGCLPFDYKGPPSPPVAELSATPHTMRSVRSGNSLNSASIAAPRPSPAKAPSGIPRHKKSFSEANVHRRAKSKPHVLTSPSSTDSKLTTCSISSNGGQTSSNDSNRARVGAENKSLQPSPLIVEKKMPRKTGVDSSSRKTDETASRKQIEELKATITAQDHTISTLQAQFGSLRASHEAHVASLTDAHAKEVATLKTYTRALEDQQSQRTLHHASSNHLLLLLDTTEPQTPNRDQSFQNPPSASGSSTRSFQTAFEQHSRSPQHLRPSPEMESLKRKLSGVKKPDTGSRDAVRELNQLKTNYVAVQNQVESLMTKLNESKRNERQLQTTLGAVEKACSEWQEKVTQLEKAEKALQNTVDHLEGRLELANIEKVDAQEQLLNLQNQHPPYDPMPAKSQAPTSRGAHISMSTVFSSGSAGSPVSNNEFQEPKTLAAFIARIDRLEGEIKDKDEKIRTLQRENENIMQDFEEVANDRRILKEVTDKFQFHSDLQKRYVMQGQEVEQLRAMVMHREEVIGEKEKALRMTERQLEHHKLLLHAEIRRHATMSMLANVNASPLPDLASLASREDIDRWVDRLRKRLKAEVDTERVENLHFSDDLEDLVADLKREIEFYVREIIYYKLDIKGYKSDIKKLQRVAARFGDRGEYDSPTPSLGKHGSSDTPVRSRFAAITASSGFSATPSPISTGPISATLSIGRPMTPPASIETPNPSPHGAGKPNTFYRNLAHPSPRTPLTPCTPPRRAGFNIANEADNIDPGISPRSIAQLSPERRKPTPPTPEQEQRGHMATNFPLSTPASPKRQDTQRSMSDAIIQMYSSPRTPDWNQPAEDKQTPRSASRMNTASRGRSSSLPEAGRGKLTPDRPPRPRYGLFESPNTVDAALDKVPTPPQKDVIAEAERHSPPHLTPKSVARRAINMSLDSSAPMLATASQPARPSTAQSLPDPIPRPLSPKRKDSTGSGSNIPFVISMGSPHNPALITPATTLPPTPCSITAKCSSGLKLQSGIRAGVGGTMASTTPVTSPTSPTGGPISSYFPATASQQPAKPSSIPTATGYGSSRNPTPAHSRSNSTTATMDIGSGSLRGANTTGSSFGHSRSVSGSSFMSAIQLPGSLMKGKGKMRRDNGSGMTISNPTPLASPFDIDGEKGGKYGIGEAI